MTYYGPDWLEDWAMAFWYPEEWLNGEWSKDKQDVFDTLYQFDIFRNRFDHTLDARNRSSYLYWNQLDYKNVRDPRKLPGSSSIVTASQLNFVSSNVKRLYR